MTDLTKGNIFDSLYFLTCVQPYASESGLAAIESECQKAVQRAQDLTAPSDAARGALHAVQAQRNSVADMAQTERLTYEGNGSLVAFRAILAAETSAERMLLASAHAADGARIKSLLGAVEHTDLYLLPKLAVAAQRADCDWLGAVATMASWNAILAGVKRQIAAGPLAAEDGQVMFSAQGGKTGEALSAASAAKGRYHSACERLSQMERNLKGVN